ncbi:hypothetical protein M406DRAFT_24731, partial [Cryphonectria parasitica EP155]
SGAKVIVPPRYLDEYKNLPALDFSAFIVKDFYATYPGFEGFSPASNGEILQNALKKQLPGVLGKASSPFPPTHQLTKVTCDLYIGRPKEWTKINLKTAVQHCVARQTSRIFLGPKLADDPEWQAISTSYATDVFRAVQRLNALPALLRPLLHWVLPECRRIRDEVRQARALINPEVERRLDEIRRFGAPRRKVLDSVDWLVAAASAKRQPLPDVGVMEIALAMASMNSTSRAVGYLLLDAACYPEYVQELRDEVVAVLAETGQIDKNMLFKLKKMDSFIRESLRIHPGLNANMPRVAQQDITFSDGTQIPKGAYLMMSPPPMLNPAVHADPDKFDGLRFFRLRASSPSNENKYQTVTTSPEMTMFGHGLHACPGRFFASNSMKLMFAYMLLNYDFALPEEAKGEPLPELYMNFQMMPDSRQMLLCRARTPEVDFLEYCEG